MEEKRLQSFLRSRMLHRDCYDLAEEIGAFRGDMLCGLAGETASLKMIPTFILPVEHVHTDGKIIVLDAGGTNLRTGVVSFEGGKVQNVTFTKCLLPGVEKELGSDEFFDAVAEKLAPYLEQSREIGFCFSYPADCTEDGDGVMQRFCKEVRVTGAEGKYVCRELLKAIRRRGVREDYSCIQLNDTVATMLGGMASVAREKYDGYIGFILGTGINACYAEKTSAIEKYHGTGYGGLRMVVNMEAGMYAGFYRGSVDERLDHASSLPGDHMAEKMLSGVYLGGIIAETMRDAAEEGLLSVSLAEDFHSVHLKEVNAFLEGKPSTLDGMGLSEDDRETVREIILAVYGRTARLMAVMFASVALHTGCGKEKPMCIVLEGSTYHKSPELKKAVDRELRALRLFYGLSFEIVCTENQTLTGAAFAALSKK